MSHISEMMSATVSKVDAMTSSSCRRARATYRLVGGLSTPHGGFAYGTG